MIVYHEQIAHSATELLVCCSSSVSCLTFSLSLFSTSYLDVGLYLVVGCLSVGSYLAN